MRLPVFFYKQTDNSYGFYVGLFSGVVYRLRRGRSLLFLNGAAYFFYVKILLCGRLRHMQGKTETNSAADMLDYIYNIELYCGIYYFFKNDRILTCLIICLSKH